MKILNYKLLVLILLIGVTSVCASTQNGNSVISEEVISKGTAAIERGDLKSAYNLIYPYAENGDAEAQFTVALIIGWGYNPDDLSPSNQEKSSLEWIRKAAIQGHPKATKLLSDSYKNGWYGLESDVELSQCWLSAANKKDIANHCATLK